MFSNLEAGPLLSENFDLRRVMPEQIGQHWSTVEKLLKEQPGLWEPLWSLESIEYSLASGGLQLWITYVDDKHFLFILSHIVIYPNSRILRFFWAAGAGIEVYMWALVDSMNEVAKELGCTHMEMEIGRTGWQREMREHGFALSRQILRREVMDSRRQ